MSFALLGVAALVTLQAPDSAATHRRMRAAQADFERYRRAHLPLRWAPGGGYQERIGRFVFWHDDGESRPPAEPPRIRDARARFLVALDSARAAFPGDGWIAGQLIRYLIEHDSTAPAPAVARRCTATRWWCLALEGLARHAAGDFARAEGAFDAALATMPPEQRCRWTDASTLLEGRFRTRYRRLDCDHRTALDAQLWWLARPLHLVPGNDRRTEHLARMAMVEIQRDARNPHGLRWGYDMTELLVRYGWETAWSAVPARTGTTEEPGVVGHQRTPAFRFLPGPAALTEPFAAAADAWDLRPVAPRGAYAPMYADSFVPIPHHATTFRRGDSTLALAAYDLSGDPGFSGQAVDVALVLSGGPGAETVITRSTRARGELVAAIGPGAVLLSLEALAGKSRRAARTRFALPQPPDYRVTVSDLLLLEPGDSLPRTLEQAVPLILRTKDLGSRRRVVVFWETYGLDPAGEPISLVLSVRRGRAGILRRRVEPVQLQWRETPRPDGPVTARSLLLDLSAFGPGTYRIELVVDAAQQDPVLVSREIRLGKPPGERASRE